MENLKQRAEMFLKEIHNSEKPIENIIFSPLGTVFATCQNDKRVVVYDSLDYTVVHDFATQYAVKDAKFISEEHLVTIDQLGLLYDFNLFQE